MEEKNFLFCLGFCSKSLLLGTKLKEIYLIFFAVSCKENEFMPYYLIIVPNGSRCVQPTVVRETSLYQHGLKGHSARKKALLQKQH